MSGEIDHRQSSTTPFEASSEANSVIESTSEPKEARALARRFVDEVSSCYRDLGMENALSMRAFELDPEGDADETSTILVEWCSENGRVSAFFENPPSTSEMVIITRVSDASMPKVESHAIDAANLPSQAEAAVAAMMSMSR